ncbi:hypothetical protein SAMN04488498_113116 [Mesorhizobium albiziae]|uniref:Uncharacterized protein n=1 Tax=Neomesorhizobium albiziae TaxID=335020 RepID=A0A1I4CL30_9HYPH|nr:hypothetical protein [Mesorhizobium albiziae]GLS29312.1 hypothetical protein GCM10007937_10200 [Mesorhizobium albiziae]SFK81443.1 hypothetical protein SAMN04488498_113116 [Mesorhizobium albiziae]
MAGKRRFDIGDEVALRGVVRLLDAAGDGTVTVELAGSGLRYTLRENSSFIELVAKGKADAFMKSPKGRQGKPIPSRDD